MTNSTAEDARLFFFFSVLLLISGYVIANFLHGRIFQDIQLKYSTLGKVFVFKTCLKYFCNGSKTLQSVTYDVITHTSCVHWSLGLWPHA